MPRWQTSAFPLPWLIRAIDSYIEVVRRQLAENCSDAWKYLNRAIELSKALSDAEREGRSRAALMELREKVRAVDAHAGQTWRFYEIAARHFDSRFTPTELGNVIADLQVELLAQSDPDSPKTFDPHWAMSTAERLQRWSRMAGNNALGPRAIQIACAAFENACRKGWRLGGCVLAGRCSASISSYR